MNETGKSTAREYEQWIREKLDKTHEHTSDDTFTPAAVYDVISSYVADRWNLDPNRFKRPFYPGGDYRKDLESYHRDDVVVDNPPFSILSRIVRDYISHDVRFFLFAPALTSLHYLSECSLLMCDARITYANKVSVATAFIHNLDNERVFEIDPILTALLAPVQGGKRQTPAKPKYIPPAGVLTTKLATALARQKVPVRLPIRGAARVSKAFTENGRAVSLFGGGGFSQKASGFSCNRKPASHRLSCSI